MKKYAVLFIVCLIGVYSCKKASKAKVKPELAFMGFSHDTVANGNPKDTVLVNFRYTMAAKKVGSGDKITQLHIKDSRIGPLSPYLFPDEVSQNIPDELLDGDLNINGTLTLRLPASLYFIMRPDRPDVDTVSYEFYLKDKDGTESDKVTSSDILILP